MLADIWLAQIPLFSNKQIQTSIYPKMNRHCSAQSIQFSKLPYLYDRCSLKQTYNQLVRIPAIGVNRAIYYNQNAVLQQNINTTVTKGIDISTNQYNSGYYSQQPIQLADVLQRNVDRDILLAARKVCLSRSLLCSDLWQTKDYIRNSKPLLTVLKQITQADINRKLNIQVQSKIVRELNLKHPDHVMRYANLGYDTSNSVIVAVTQNYQSFVPLSKFIQMARCQSEQSSKHSAQTFTSIIPKEVTGSVTYVDSLISNQNNNYSTYKSKIGALSQSKILLIVSRVLKAYSDIFEIQRKLYKYYSEINQLQTDQKLSQNQLLQKCSLLKYINPERDILVDPSTFEVRLYNFGFREDLDAITYEFRESMADTDWVYRHPSNINLMATCDNDKTKYNQKYVIEGLSREDIFWQMWMLIFRLCTGLWPFISSKTGKPMTQIGHSNIRQVHEQMVQISRQGIKAVKNIPSKSAFKQCFGLLPLMLESSQLFPRKKSIQYNPNQRWSLGSLFKINNVIKKIWNVIAMKQTQYIYKNMSSSAFQLINKLHHCSNQNKLLDQQLKNQVKQTFNLQEFLINRPNKIKPELTGKQIKNLTKSDQHKNSDEQMQISKKIKQKQIKTQINTSKKISLLIKMKSIVKIFPFNIQKQFDKTRVEIKIKIFPMIQAIKKIQILIKNLINQVPETTKKPQQKNELMLTQYESAQQKDQTIVKLATIAYILVLETRYRCMEAIQQFNRQKHQMTNLNKQKNQQIRLLMIRFKEILMIEIKSLNAIIVSFSKLFQTKDGISEEDEAQNLLVKYKDMDLGAALKIWSKHFLNLLVYSNTIQNVAYKQQYLQQLNRYEQSNKIRQYISMFSIDIYKHFQEIRTAMGNIGVSLQIEQQLVFIERALKFDAILEKMKKQKTLDLATFQKSFQQVQFIINHVYILETVLEMLPSISNFIVKRQRYVSQFDSSNTLQLGNKKQQNKQTLCQTAKQDSILQSSTNNLELASPQILDSSPQIQDQQQQIQNTLEEEEQKIYNNFKDWSKSIDDNQTMMDCNQGLDLFI